MLLIVKWVSLFPRRRRRRPTQFDALSAAMPVPFSQSSYLRSFRLSVSSYLADVCNWAGRAWRLARAWKVRGTNSGGERNFRTVRTGLGTHPAS